MCLECAYSQLQRQILKSLQGLKLTNSHSSTGYSYPDLMNDWVLTSASIYLGYMDGSLKKLISLQSEGAGTTSPSPLPYISVKKHVKTLRKRKQEAVFEADGNHPVIFCKE